MFANNNEQQVHLLGPSGGEVKSRRVPLRLVLMYDNMHRVQNQEILKLSPDSKLVIDEHGKATLRVRIEEVSKNHQKQVNVYFDRPAVSAVEACVIVQGVFTSIR